MDFEVADRLRGCAGLVYEMKIDAISFLVNYFFGVYLRTRFAVVLNRIEGLLRGDNAADGVAARQHDSTMIHCVGRIVGRGLWQDGTLDKSAAAGWAPVGLGFGAEHSMALAANTFHK